MQQTPLDPALQLPQFFTVDGQQIPHSKAPFAFTVAHQSLEQLPHLANVNLASGLGDGAYCQQSAYGLTRLNIHVLLLCGVHCFLSLRYQSDFSIAVGNTHLIEAEQLSFWKFNSQQYSNCVDDLEVDIEECL